MDLFFGFPVGNYLFCVIILKSAGTGWDEPSLRHWSVTQARPSPPVTMLDRVYPLLKVEAALHLITLAVLPSLYLFNCMASIYLFVCIFAGCIVDSSCILYRDLYVEGGKGERVFRET